MFEPNNGGNFFEELYIKRRSASIKNAAIFVYIYIKKYLYRKINQ